MATVAVVGAPDFAFVPLIAASPGCRSCQLLQAKDDPTRIVVIEVWDSASAYQASLKGGPPDVIAEPMKLLAALPTGRYYRGVSAEAGPGGSN